MHSFRTFTISEQSSLLTPGAHGMKTLFSALREGHSIVAAQSGDDPISMRRDGRQMLYCETSGTSGRAKIIRRHPASWIESFNLNQRAFDLTSGDTYATFGHPGHSLSLYAVLEALHLGADILPLTGVSPKRQIAQLTEKKASVLYATPAQLHLLLAGAQAAGVGSISRVRKIFSGGGKLEPHLRAPLARLFSNAAIHEFFGASETSFVTMADADTPELSVGLPYGDVSLDIRGDGPLGPMETGEIWVKSSYLFDGYEGALPPDTRWDGDYLSIGEMGYRDAAGYLYLRGRKNRMVTVTDKNVFPEEIEKLLMALPQIGRCVALAQPDPKRGHRIICVIEGKKQEALEARIRRTCRNELGAHAQPHRFVYVNTIPLLAAGKPDIQALKAHMEAVL